MSFKFICLWQSFKALPSPSIWIIIYIVHAILESKWMQILFMQTNELDCIPLQLIMQVKLSKQKVLANLLVNREPRPHLKDQNVRTCVLCSRSARDALEWFAKTRTGARSKVAQGVSQPSQRRWHTMICQFYVNIPPISSWFFPIFLSYCEAMFLGICVVETREFFLLPGSIIPADQILMRTMDSCKVPR